MNQDVIEAEARPLAIREEAPRAELALFPAATPAERATQMVDLATVFVGLARQRNAEAIKDGRAPLIVEMIDKKTGRKSEHLTVPLWRTLGALLPRSITATIAGTERIEGGWKARAVAKTLDGIELGAAEMLCTREEGFWKYQSDSAICSMAQTRAQGKALRGVLDFLVVLAGFNGTPAEEMPRDEKPPREEKPQLSPQQAADRGRKSLKALCRDKGIPDCDYREAMVSLFGPAIWKERGFDGPTSKALDADELRKLYSHLKNRGTR